MRLLRDFPVAFNGTEGEGQRRVNDSLVPGPTQKTDCSNPVDLRFFRDIVCALSDPTNNHRPLAVITREGQEVEIVGNSFIYFHQISGPGSGH
jgi:hypothetical protein